MSGLTLSTASAVWKSATLQNDKSGRLLYTYSNFGSLAEEPREKRFKEAPLSVFPLTSARCNVANIAGNTSAALSF